jgi:nucleotide-binding universal stress UspA family protein
MFRLILVPLDGSRAAEAAVPVAARLAHASRGVVILLHVVRMPPWYMDPDHGDGSVRDAEELDTTAAAASAYLADLARGDLLGDLPVFTAVTGGPVAGTILAIAHEYRADLIVLCAHTRARLMRWMRWRVSTHVAQRAAVPVLLLRGRVGAPAVTPFDARSRR